MEPKRSVPFCVGLNGNPSSIRFRHQKCRKKRGKPTGDDSDCTLAKQKKRITDGPAFVNGQVFNLFGHAFVGSKKAKGSLRNLVSMMPWCHDVSMALLGLWPCDISSSASTAAN